MLNGMNALSAEPGLTKSDQPIEVETVGTLMEGPAYRAGSSAQSAAADPSDWPTSRHDNARTGTTTSSVPAELDKRWEVKIGTCASAPVIAGGRVFVADVDGYAVCALNAADGKTL
jgi:hypothetical protein